MEQHFVIAVIKAYKAENVMDVQFPQLDWSYIEHWCGQHDRLGLLQEIRSGLEPLP